MTQAETIKESANKTRHAAVISKVCHYIEQAETIPTLAELAELAGLSAYHFHRVFKQATGLTPKAYASAQLGKRVRHELDKNRTVTDAIYEAGYKANSRFYENADQTLGMTPSEYRKGAPGITIRFAIAECTLGALLVAASEQGICAISLGNDPERLIHELQDRFKNANLIGADRDFETLVARVISCIETPQIGLDLPLDIRGTAFQQRVWQALRQIPSGTTVSYTDLANRIGSPKAVRAVASACAANTLAVVIPCHRVVRLDGDLSGYRWGVERKRTLLEREKAK